MLIFSIKSHLICTQVQSVPLILKPYLILCYIHGAQLISSVVCYLPATVSVCESFCSNLSRCGKSSCETDLCKKNSYGLNSFPLN